MNVSELIENLKKMDPDTELEFCVYTTELHKKKFEITDIKITKTLFNPCYVFENTAKILIEEIKD